jgi:hypothetical protein
MHKTPQRIIFYFGAILFFLMIINSNSQSSSNFTIEADTVENNNEIKNLNNYNIDRNTDNSNDIIPNQAATSNFNGYGLNENFNSINTTLWNVSATEYISIYIANQALRFYTSNTGVGARTAEVVFKNNLNTLDISNLQINYSLKYNFTNPNISNYFKWQYASSYDAIIWNDINNANATKLSTIGLTERDTYEFRSFNLQNEMGSSPTNLFLKLKVSFDLDPTLKPSWVDIDFIQMGQYWSVIDYNTVHTDLDQEIIVNYNVRSNFTYSGLYSADYSKYKLHYEYGTGSFTIDGTEPTINSEHVSTNGIYLNLRFRIPETVFQTNGFLRFRIRIQTTTYDILSPLTYEINAYDGIAPTFTSETFKFNGTPPASIQFNYTDSLNLSFGVADTGGMNLSHVNIYWRIGDSSVSNVIGSYSNFTTFTFIGTLVKNATVNISIPETAFNASVPTYFRVYIFDRSGNSHSNPDVFNITAEDKLAPDIYFISQSSNSVEYNGIASFEFEFREPFDGIGFNQQNNTALKVCWKVNSAPDNATDFTSSAFEYPRGQFIFNLPFTIDIYNQLGNVLGNNIYFWVNIGDKSNNIQSSYAGPIIFFVNDTQKPMIAPTSESRGNVGYHDNKTIAIQVSEDPYASKVNGSSIKVFMRRNNATFDLANMDQITQATGLQISGSNSDPIRVVSATISNDYYFYQDTITVHIFVADLYGNEATSSFNFSVKDVYKPSINMDWNIAATNLTQARTLYDLKITVNAYDDVGGSGVQFVELKISSSNSNWGSVGTIATASYISPGKYQFLISRNQLSPGDQYYYIRVFDNEENQDYIQGNFTVVEQIARPIVTEVLYNGSARNYINQTTFDFKFQVSGNCLMYLYVNNQLKNTIAYQGNQFTYRFQDLTEGSYVLSIKYFNLTWSGTFYVDITAPLAVPTNSIKITNQNYNVTMVWNYPEESENELLTYQIFYGSKPDFNIYDYYESHYLGETSERTLSFIISTAGVYYFKIIARDQAGNWSPVSDAVKYEHKTASNNLIMFGGIGAAVAVGAGLTVMKLKRRSVGKTLEERAGGIVTEGDKKPIKGNIWDDVEEKTAPKKEENIWEDLSSDGWTKSSKTTSNTANATPQPTNSAAPFSFKSGFNATASSTAATGATVPMGDPTTRFDPQMKELYNNAQEFMDMGQESMAAKSYEMLLRMAEKKGDAQMIAFIKQKMGNVF